MIRERGRDNDAVSPVIGVMLMIVVTIIIAAIVSAFAGGFSDQQKKTPSSQIEVTLRQAVNSSGFPAPQLIFTHKGGDPVATSDLMIVTHIDGQKHVTDGSLDYENAANHFAASQVGGVWPATHFTSNDGYPCKWRMNTRTCDPTGMWGNFTLLNGDILTMNVDDPNTLASVLGTANIGTASLYNNNNAGKNIPVQIEIIHIPSGRVISSSELVYV